MTPEPLGWVAPTDFTHQRTYALERFGTPGRPTPVVIGIPWYTNFDTPVRDRDGNYYIGLGGLGDLRGGHCVCLRPPTLRDPTGAWQHYDQGKEGACVGHGTSRAATLFNARLYDAFPLYKAAQQIDPFPGDQYSGTTVNAGLSVLRNQGPWRLKYNTSTPTLRDGILAYAWASSIQEVMNTLHSQEEYVRILNSWGTRYPAEVRMPVTVLHMLLSRGGEAGVPIDRIGKSATERR